MIKKYFTKKISQIKKRPFITLILLGLVTFQNAAFELNKKITYLLILTMLMKKG